MPSTASDRDETLRALLVGAQTPTVDKDTANSLLEELHSLVNTVGIHIEG
jgi:hypothetical protein